MSEQLDLFDTRDHDAEAQALRAWKARMIPADWIAPYDCGYGPAGTVVRGWKCPACGTVEPSDFTLSINHGLDPERPGREDFLERCISMGLRDAHDAYERRT